jgi:hypothetical protein
MKTLALLLFLAGGSAVLADTGVLQNGDFSDGIAHWEGDCHTAGSDSDDSAATSGIVVKLRSSDWTHIHQDFEAKAGDYILTITYVVSPGLTLSQRPEDYKNASIKMGLGGMRPFDGKLNDWCMLVVDSGVNMGEVWEITPVLTASGVQTIKAHVTIKSSDSHLKGFFLCFPPGSGSINLQSIMLVPFGGSTAASS